MDSFYLWILGLLALQPGQRLLDVSCGEGQLLKFATRQGIIVHGIDLSKSAIGCSRQTAPQAHLVVGDAETLPYADNSFDALTNIGSLDNYDQPDRAVQEMARVLIPGGKVCISVLNTFGLRWSVIHAWRTGDVADDGYQPIQRYGTRMAWQRMLERHGLRVYQTLGYEHERAFPRTWRDAWNYIISPRRVISALAVRLIPLNMATTFVFFCQKCRE